MADEIPSTAVLRPTGDNECVVCYTNLVGKSKVICARNHLVCPKCLRELKNACPMCRDKYDADLDNDWNDPEEPAQEDSVVVLDNVPDLTDVVDWIWIALQQSMAEQRRIERQNLVRRVFGRHELPFPRVDQVLGRAVRSERSEQIHSVNLAPGAGLRSVLQNSSWSMFEPHAPMRTPLNNKLIQCALCLNPGELNLVEQLMIDTRHFPLTRSQLAIEPENQEQK